MDLKTFFEHFDTLAEAPNGIQRLRELILDMAVRGKLVPQDPEDEPAEEFLKRIRRRKKELISSGEVPKPKRINVDAEESEAAFKVPKGWIWTSLDEISSYIQRGKSPKYDDFGKVLVISQKCIQWSGFDIGKARNIKDETISAYGQERFLRTGDLLWNSTGTGTVGRINVFPRNFAEHEIVADSHVTVIRPIECRSKFLYCWLASPLIQLSIEDKTSGTTKQQELNTSTVRLEPVPLPPLAEQKRIVAKVDELMGLCDALEAAQQNRNTLRQNLRASALDALMNATSDDELATAWAFVRDHWGMVSDRPEDVKDYRKLILNIAVQGKLVSQDSKDESAAVLAKKIRARRSELENCGSIRKYKSPGKISAEIVPYLLPNSWQWVWLDEISDIGTGSTPLKTNPEFYANGTVPWITSSATSGDLIIQAETCITNLAVEKHRLRIYPPGSLLIALYGQGKTRGQIARLGISAAINQACAAITFFEAQETLADYLQYFFTKKYEEIRSLAAGGAQPNLNVAKIKATLIPLPPLAEQKRIVAKVDELMQLCDQLEESLRQQQQYAQALVTSAISHLTA